VSLKIWALKSSELKGMTRTGLLLFGCRCAMRVESWIPPKSNKLWMRGLAHVTSSIDSPIDVRDTEQLERDLSNCGAMALNQFSDTDEPRGQCMNYATQTLAMVVYATTIKDEKKLKKAIIDTAKFSASIPAILAHANRITAPDGENPVDFACVTMWDAIRSDIQMINDVSSSFITLRNRVNVLRDLCDFGVMDTFKSHE
jgi:hypothetical protein